jgi:hypothetical protein
MAMIDGQLQGKLAATAEFCCAGDARWKLPRANYQASWSIRVPCPGGKGEGAGGCQVLVFAASAFAASVVTSGVFGLAATGTTGGGALTLEIVMT